MTTRCARAYQHLTSAMTVLLAAGLAAAGGGGDPHTGGVEHAHGHETLAPIPDANAGMVTGITALVVFALVFAVLAAKVWPVIARGLDERANKIRSEIEAAELAQRKATQALAEYERNLAAARAEAQKMLDDAKAEQQALAADLKAKSEIELNAMREKAKRDIEVAKKAAVDEIYGHAVSAATSMASKILRREIGAHDQQRLIQESLGELQAAVARSN